MKGHTARVNTVAVMPDGRYAVSGSTDTTVRLWDLASGECLLVLRGHEKEVWDVAVSPNGRFLASGGEDATIRLWELNWDYEFYQPSDWDERAISYLRVFLAARRPHGRGLLGRRIWSEKDFQQLLIELRHCGFGWLRPEGVRRELEKMAKDWKGLPALPLG
jgi:WD40 repeat protein